MPTIKGFVVRESDGVTLRFFHLKPNRVNKLSKSSWNSSASDFEVWEPTLRKQFEHLTWQDEPVEAELSINIL